MEALTDAGFARVASHVVPALGAVRSARHHAAARGVGEDLRHLAENDGRRRPQRDVSQLDGEARAGRKATVSAQSSTLSSCSFLLISSLKLSAIGTIHGWSKSGSPDWTS